MAEADQSCDGIGDLADDHYPSASVNQEWNEGEAASHRESAVGLDEVPTRLMSVLTAPGWSRAHSSPTSDDLSRNNSWQRTEPESTVWFPEDDSI